MAPTDLREFLVAQGWTLRREAFKDRLYLLENARFPRRQLVFPMDIEVPDYADAVETALAKFSEITGETLDAVVARMEVCRDDVLRLRVFFDGDDSSLPLGFAASLVQSTEKLLRAAVCTVLKPRTHHPRLSLTETAQFIERARFAQTEQGSFILRVACPLHGMETPGDVASPSEQGPFVRQVMLALHDAMDMLVTAIETDTLGALVDELKSSERPLLSSNLCDALSAMHDERLGNALDVDFNWSVLRPGPVSRARPLRFQKDYFARIEEVRRELRAPERHQEGAFIGSVERLDGEMGEDGRRSGEVVLSILLPAEGETVRARAILCPEDYQKAHRAHMRSGAYVQVVGQLAPGRQPRQLLGVSKFEVIE